MDSILLAAKLILLLLICGTGPGLLIVGRLRWSPMEKLCGVFAASFVAIYLAGLALFTLHAPVAAYWGASGVFAAMGIAGHRTARMLFCRRATRRALLAFGVVLGWEFLHLALVRHYDGGNWSGDWHEHYERTCYFLGQLPDRYLFMGRYLLPARPPLMNVIAAFFCRQVGLSFQAYALVFLFLNAFAFLPCCLLLRWVVPRARLGARMVPVLAVLFMMNPSIMQNATLTVTKALTAGLVVLGVCFYLRGRVVTAAVTFAAAMLAHYSAGPYALAVGLHYGLTFLPRRRPLKQAIFAAVASGGLMATWWGWSVAVYGTHDTFFSNTTAIGTAGKSLAANVRRTLYNTFTSFVPHPLHAVPNVEYSRMRNWGEVRDYVFMMSQTTLPMMIGIAGGIAAIVLVGGMMVRLQGRGKRFWAFFLVVSIVVGIAANADPEPYGCAQVTLQALAIMGVTLVAARLVTLGAIAFRLILVGTAVDYCLGVLLHFDRQSYVYPMTTDASGAPVVTPDPALGHVGFWEYIDKLHAKYVFWGDRLVELAPGIEVASLVIAILALWFVVRFRARFARRQVRLLPRG